MDGLLRQRDRRSRSAFLAGILQDIFDRLYRTCDAINCLLRQCTSLPFFLSISSSFPDSPGLIDPFSEKKRVRPFKRGALTLSVSASALSLRCDLRTHRFVQCGRTMRPGCRCTDECTEPYPTCIRPEILLFYLRFLIYQIENPYEGLVRTFASLFFLSYFFTHCSFYSFFM